MHAYYAYWEYPSFYLEVKTGVGEHHTIVLFSYDTEYLSQCQTKYATRALREKNYAEIILLKLRTSL